MLSVLGLHSLLLTGNWEKKTLWLRLRWLRQRLAEAETEKTPLEIITRSPYKYALPGFKVTSKLCILNGLFALIRKVLSLINPDQCFKLVPRGYFIEERLCLILARSNPKEPFCCI